MVVSIFEKESFFSFPVEMIWNDGRRMITLTRFDLLISFLPLYFPFPSLVLLSSVLDMDMSICFNIRFS